MAETGYLSQYDFPGQGADWYAGADAPNTRYDFFVAEIDTFSDGSDFDLGYMISADLFGFDSEGIDRAGSPCPLP